MTLLLALELKLFTFLLFFSKFKGKEINSFVSSFDLSLPLSDIFLTLFESDLKIMNFEKKFFNFGGSFVSLIANDIVLCFILFDDLIFINNLFREVSYFVLLLF